MKFDFSEINWALVLVMVVVTTAIVVVLSMNTTYENKLTGDTLEPSIYKSKGEAAA
jgi:hypothetical protein